MTNEERKQVADLLAASEALIHWCDTLAKTHAELVELAADAGVLTTADADKHQQRLTETHGVLEAHRRQTDRFRTAFGLKSRVVH